MVYNSALMRKVLHYGDGRQWEGEKINFKTQHCPPLGKI